jgi:hypothetical protein
LTKTPHFKLLIGSSSASLISKKHDLLLNRFYVLKNKTITGFEPRFVNKHYNVTYLTKTPHFCQKLSFKNFHNSFYTF